MNPPPSAPPAPSPPTGNKNDINMPSENCSICLEPLEGDIRILRCTHRFHTPCLRKWEQQNRHRNCTCPNCRENINLEQPILNVNSNHPVMRRRLGRRNIFEQQNQDINPHNMFMNNVMLAHMAENAIPIDGNDFIHHTEARMLRPANNSENITESDIKIMVTLVIVIFVIGFSVLVISITNDMCMCKYKWGQGATSLTIDGWFGLTTTYERPLICSNWC